VCQTWWTSASQQRFPRQGLTAAVPAAPPWVAPYPNLPQYSPPFVGFYGTYAPDGQVTS
jgi:hypothetical protein